MHSCGSTAAYRASMLESSRPLPAAGSRSRFSPHMPRCFYVFAAIFIGLAACEPAVFGSTVNSKNLIYVLETMSTQRGWAATGSAQVRLDQLRSHAIWDVQGTVRMLDAAPGLPSASLEESLAVGTAELEHITSEQLASRVEHIGKRLGNGGPCAVSPATADDARRAAVRLRSLRIPTSIGSALRSRIERFQQRALKVADGPFHRGGCDPRTPILFGWLDGKPVPLEDFTD